MGKVEAGKSYRLRRHFEVRDDRTGTMKQFLHRGTTLKVKRISPDEGSLWVEGVSLPLPLDAFSRAVEPAG